MFSLILGFSRGNNMKYNTSGQSVSSAGGSVIFNVIVKVKNGTDEGNKGGVNDRTKIATENKDKGENFRRIHRFSDKEEKSGSMWGFETDTGLPVMSFPVQEEQTSLTDHQVNFPIQEQIKSRQSLEEPSVLPDGTVNQECCCHSRLNTFPMQEDGKSEHLPKEEENQ